MKQLTLPKKLKVDDKWYSVDVVETMHKKSMMGEAHYPSQTITLGRKTHHGVPFKLSALHETFWHELVHCILHSMGEDKLNDNEAFVEEFSHRLAKAIETARF